MKLRNFRELEEKMPAESRARVKAWVEQEMKNMPLHELRAARQLTQENLAEVLHINQAAVSKIERKTDMYVSTLARFIEAMGGKLEIRAVFPDGVVKLERFGEKNKDSAA